MVTEKRKQIPVYRKQDLGTFLRKARERAGLSQGDVAKLMGYANAQFVSNIERGVCFPVHDSVKRYASILKIDRSEIVDRILQIKKRELEREWK